MAKPKRTESTAQTDIAPSLDQVDQDELDISMEFLSQDECMIYMVAYPSLEVPLKKRIGSRIVSIH